MRYLCAATIGAVLFMPLPGRAQDSDPQPADPDAPIQYNLERTEPLSRFTPRQLDLVEKLNRVDRRDLPRLRVIVVPDRWNLPVLDYSPLPRFVPGFESHPRAIIIDLPGQVFGAYENGRMVRWGPVSTGKGSTATPPGSYHLNWKSRLRISSVDPDWKMPYYFNFADRLGLGMHEYQMPGRPASHGCIRMLPVDAEWLFDWGQGGTPVVIVGQYHFGEPKPWLQPRWLEHGVQLPSNLMSGGRT